MEDINEWRPDVVVLDEAHSASELGIENVAREVKKLKSRYAVVLTGTPLENKLEELYSIVQFVDERRFGPAFQFLHDHRVLDENYNLKGYRNLEKIREKLAAVFLRRTRGEVLTRKLPPRTDNTVFVELDAEQRGPYEDQRRAAGFSKRTFSPISIASGSCRRWSTCGWSATASSLLDKQSRVSPKLVEFAELVADITTEDHKAVVFSQWETMILEAAKVLNSLGIGYAVLHGGWRVRSERMRLERSSPTRRVGSS